MIPSSTISMKSLMEYHTQRFYRNTFESVFGNSNLIKKMSDLGFTNNPKLSQLNDKFKILDQLRNNFKNKCAFAGPSNIAMCLAAEIEDIRKEYEVKLNYVIRGIKSENKLEIDVQNEDINWPTAYVAYHCKQEGFDAEIRDLGVLSLYEVSTVEVIAIKKIEHFLRELAAGTAHAIFIDELRTQMGVYKPINVVDSEQIVVENSEFEEIDPRVLAALIPLNGNNLNGQKIMSADEFRRILEYTHYLVECEQVPKNMKQISQTQASNEFIRMTYNLLHKQLYGRTRRNYWFDFIHEAFFQFRDVEITTTKKHFTIYGGRYEIDKEKMLKSQVSLKSP